MNICCAKSTVTAATRQVTMQQHARADPGDSASLGRNDTQSVGSTTELMGPAAMAAARWRRGRPDDRLKRAVRRVLIALSFKSNKGRSRSVEPGSKQQLQQQYQQQSLQLSSWQLIPGTSIPPSTYWDPVRYSTFDYNCHDVFMTKPSRA